MLTKLDDNYFKKFRELIYNASGMTFTEINRPILDSRIADLLRSHGNITVDENSSLSLRIKTELPTNLSINNAVYHDTLENSLYQAFSATIPQSIETMTIRIAITNAFPFDIIPDIVFLNTHTGEKYPLDINNIQIHGAYNGVPYTNTPIYIDFSNDAAQKIIKSDKVIFNFRVTTNGNTVEIKDSQYINIAMGARIKYTNINL